LPLRRCELAIVAGTILGAIAHKKSIRLDPVKKDLDRQTCQNDGDCHMKVEVTDKSGIKLLSEVKL